MSVAHLGVTFSLQDGETPLLRATQKKHTAIVSLLLEKGASVSVADKASCLLNCHIDTFLSFDEVSVEGNLFLDMVFNLCDLRFRKWSEVGVSVQPISQLSANVSIHSQLSVNLQITDLSYQSKAHHRSADNSNFHQFVAVSYTSSRPCVFPWITIPNRIAFARHLTPLTSAYFSTARRYSSSHRCTRQISTNLWASVEKPEGRAPSLSTQ